MTAAMVGRAAMLAAAASAGPIAGGQLALLAKPFGGALGVPGAVVGYLALTALLLGTVTGAVCVRFALSARGVGVCAVTAGAALAAAGVTTAPMPFTVAILLAAAASGPLLVTARTRCCSHRSWLTAWHLALAAGLAAAAAIAAATARNPGAGLLVAGIATAVGGLLSSILEPAPAQRDSAATANETETPPGSATGRGSGSATASAEGTADAMVLGYVSLGVLVGGTVLPTLHLLLFRWDALTADQAALLLWAALPAAVAVALPGPRPAAIPILLLLAAGGPILAATAPGRATAAAGLGLTLAAAARVANGLDTLYLDRIGRIGSAAATFGLMTVAGVAGLFAVTVCGRLFGTGTALTLLAVPIALAAACYSRMLSPPAVVRTAAPALEGGSS